MKVLAELISSFDGQGELTMLGAAVGEAGGGIAGSRQAIPAAVKDEAAFQQLLEQLYGKGSIVQNTSEAVAVAELPDYWHCPNVLHTVDSLLAVRLLTKNWAGATASDDSAVCRLFIGIKEIVDYMRVANKLKLRRCVLSAVHVAGTLPFMEKTMQKMDRSFLMSFSN
jgi:hypothetical protein